MNIPTTPRLAVGTATYVPSSFRTRPRRFVTHAIACFASATVLLLGACGGGEDAPADPLDRFANQVIDWKVCDPTLVPGKFDGTAYAETIAALGERARCTLMRAPLDYANPDRGEVVIALLRVAAETRQQRRGAILFNPGGPGDDGLFLAPLFARLWGNAKASGSAAAYKQLSQSYDLVGFSPRGTGASTRLTCGSNEQLPFVASPSADRSAANVQAMFDVARLQAAACDKNPLTPFINSDATARDMDLVRRVLRDDKLNYFGFSYGTWLGVWYASLFPERTDRLVLSGSVDITTTLPGVFLLQGMSMQRALDAVLAPYAARHPDRFALGSDPDEVRRVHPTLPMNLRAATSEVLVGTMGNAIHADKNVLGLRAAQVLADWLAPYLDVTGPALDPVEALINAKIATPHAFVPIDNYDAIARTQASNIAGGYFSKVRRETNPVDLGAHESTQWAVACNDTAPGWDEGTWVAANDRNAAAYPFWGGYWTSLPCLYWGGPSVTRPALDGALRVPGILMLQTQFDPQTAVEGARRTLGALTNAAMVEVDGEITHGVLPPYGNDCVDQPFAEYMLSGRLPPRESAHCAGNPLPADRTTSSAGTGKALALPSSRAALFNDPDTAARLLRQIQELIARSGPTPR